MTRRPPSLMLLVPLFATAAVACAKSPEQVKSDELQRTVASLRAQTAAYLRQVEELENQVFILSDRAESKQVNAERIGAPALPRVTLRPADSTESVAYDDARAGQGRGSSRTLRGSFDDPKARLERERASVTGNSFADEDSQVEYVGDAARSSGDRPVLRLVGDNGGISAHSAGDAAADRPVPARRPAATIPAVALRGREKIGTVQSERQGGEQGALALYRGAMDQLTAGAQADAAAAFREFLRRFPRHDYADNAQYWLGECYYDLKDHMSAVREFRRVVENFPDGNKVPDALLKAGFALLSLGDVDGGRRSLVELRRAYPQHPTARLAAEKLAELDGNSDPAQGAAEASANNSVNGSNDDAKEAP